MVIPVPPSPSPSLTDVLVRTRRPLGLNLLPRIEPKPRPDVDAVKILRDAAKQRRKNGEKFSTMLPDEVLKQQLKHLFGESDSQGSEPDGARRRRSRRPAASAAARVDAAARRRSRPTVAAREPRRSDPSGAEPAPAASPAVRVQSEPARRLRYVVPPKDADKENALGEKAPGIKRNARVQAEVQVGVQARPEPADAVAGFPGDAPRTGEATATATATARRGARRPPGGRTRRRGTRSRAGAPDVARAGFQEGPEGESPREGPSGGGDIRRNRRRRPETLRFTDAAKDTRDAAVLAEFEAA